MPRALDRCLLLALLLLPKPIEAETRIAGRAQELQPEIRWSGRVSAIARHPANPREVVVSVPRGRLFRSRDGGRTWSSVESLPAVYLNDVAYHPDDAGVLVATARRDFRNFFVSSPSGPIVTSGGGIWISRDGGDSWSRPRSAVPLAARRFADVGTCPPRYSAWGITFDEDGAIFIGTDCGGTRRVLYRASLAGDALHGPLRRSPAGLRLIATPDARAGFRVADGGALAAGNAPALDTVVEMIANDGGLEVERSVLRLAADPAKPRRQVGSGRGKLNALQVTEVSGQTVMDAGRHDLYFATQDNDIWSSSDGGPSWPESQRVEYGGFGLDLERRVARETDARVTFTKCGSCWTRITEALLANPQDWNDPFDDRRFDHGYPLRIDDKGAACRSRWSAAPLPLASFDASNAWKCLLREYLGTPHPEPPPFSGLEPGFDSGWLLHDGHLTGARVRDGRLLGAEFSPGTTVVGVTFGRDDDNVRRVLEELQEILAQELPAGFTEAPGLARVAANGRIVGLLTREGRLAALVTAETAVSRQPRALPGSDPKARGTATPPLAGKPHVAIDDPPPLGSPAAVDSVVIRPRGFAGEAPFEVEVDDRPYEVFPWQKAEAQPPGATIFLDVAEDGELLLRLPLANLPNATAETLHRVVVRQRLEDGVLEGVDHFALRHHDGNR